MADTPTSRFTAQNKTAHERLSNYTVGLVELSDFRKRRAEALEQQERDAREAALGSAKAANPDSSVSVTPVNASDNSDADRQQPPKKKKKKKKKASRTKALVSFGEEDEDQDEDQDEVRGPGPADDEGKKADSKDDRGDSKERGESEDGGKDKKSGSKIRTGLAPVPIVPRVMTKAALKREAAEREALRKEFLALQAAIKATEIAIPFVFYDGTNIPGGIVRVRKGDFIWVFLDKSRKVGARLGVGGEKISNARRAWARVSVDDLLMVRGSIIIPHHYEFYFFVMNKTIGPGNQPLFDFKAEAPPAQDTASGPVAGPVDPLSNAKENADRSLADISTLEGAKDDPTFTKVVDRRWYERNKHIYPANTWQEFDPEKDYQNEIRRDLGGNAFFFSK